MDIDANIELAKRLGCFTEGEVASLAGVKQSTLESWRKRGQGPDYILFGNNYFYTNQAILAFFQTVTRVRGGTKPRQAIV